MPASANGCSGNNIDATLDDEAGSPVETQCAATVPTILGTFSPNNPLSAFDGQTLAGTWRITVSDNAGADLGTLNEWCLAPATNLPPSIFSDGFESGNTSAWSGASSDVPTNVVSGSSAAPSTSSWRDRRGRTRRGCAA